MAVSAASLNLVRSNNLPKALHAAALTHGAFRVGFQTRLAHLADIRRLRELTMPECVPSSMTSALRTNSTVLTKTQQSDRTGKVKRTKQLGDL